MRTTEDLESDSPALLRERLAIAKAQAAAERMSVDLDVLFASTLPATLLRQVLFFGRYTVLDEDMKLNISINEQSEM